MAKKIPESLQKPFEIPARFLDPKKWENNKELVRKLIYDRIAANKKWDLPYDSGIKPFKIGGETFEIRGMKRFSEGKAKSIPFPSPRSTTKKAREPEIDKQTSDLGGAEKSPYGAGKRGLPKGQHDHHLRFRSLMQPFYEGLNEADAKALTEWFVENEFPLGNVIENLEGIDKDLHQETWDSIHTWAKDNQIDVDKWTVEESNRGLRNIQDGKVLGGADGDVIETPKVKGQLDQPRLPRNYPTVKATKSKFPNLANLSLNQRLAAATHWIETIEEPLLNKMGSLLERQDLRYAAKDPNYKTKTAQEWVNKWKDSARNAAARSKILTDNPNVSAVDLDSAEPHLFKDTIKGKLSKVGKVFNNLTSKTRTADLVAQTATGVATGNPIQAGVAGGTLATTQVLQSPQVQKRIAKQIAELVAKRGVKTAAKFMPGVDIVISGAESWDYLKQGKLDQAGIAALSGAIGWVPVIGDGAAAALDLTNTGIDISRLDFNQQADTKKKKFDTDIPNNKSLKILSKVF